MFVRSLSFLEPSQEPEFCAPLLPCFGREMQGLESYYTVLAAHSSQRLVAPSGNSSGFKFPNLHAKKLMMVLAVLLSFRPYLWPRGALQ